MSTLNLTHEWDKTFPKSELVDHSKVTFHNRYGIELEAVDYLSTCDLVDLERIGIIGICGFGGVAINAAALDPRSSIPKPSTSATKRYSRCTASKYLTWAQHWHAMTANSIETII